jgi:AcrR family transcriptional regulator
MTARRATPATVPAIIPARMTSSTNSRREPVQERSRRTVRQILNAAEQIITETGVDAVTTRNVAERAGVAAPSLYRFFADRDEILDALLEQMATDLDQHVHAAEAASAPKTIEDLIDLELDAYAGYYQTHPTAAALWFGGRASPAVIDSIRNRNDAIAARIRAILTDHQLVKDTTPTAVFDMLVELGDRVLEAAFREPGPHSHEKLELGKIALTAYLERWATT